MNNILFIGAGALGVMYADYIQDHSQEASVYFVADQDRIERYTRDGFFCNGRRCEFSYLPAGNCAETANKKVVSISKSREHSENITADLLFFCVKTYDLEDAIWAVRPYVKPETIVISVMNGISSEEIIREQLGLCNVLDGMSMGGSILREDNQISFAKMGYLYIGAHEERQKEALKQVKDFFDKIQLPYVHHENIQKKMWEKFMVNVGNNQTSSVYRVAFGPLCDRDGEPYKVAHQAMGEVIAIAAHYGVEITREDVEFWDQTAEGLHPDAKSSMLQDVEAGRQTEVEHFAGEVIRRGKQWGVPTPVNQMLYEKITNIYRK